MYVEEREREREREMGITSTSTSKSKSKSSSNSEGWGMGFLLVLFPEEDQKKKPNNLNPFSPSSFKRTNSSNILYKAQSTISICLLILFTTLLLFALSTFPSSATTTAAARRLYRVPRRKLSSTTPQFNSNSSHALQGMGTLYRRGTRAMSELVVAHAVESLTQHELKTFLRLFHRSALASKSDLLLIFPSKTVSFDRAILEENDSFFKLLTQYKSTIISHSTESFDVTHFTKLSKKEKASGEPIWGRRTRSNSSEGESTRLSYGSVVGFDVEELDPENSLFGFVDHVQISLRRWACYPMLLGRVRRNFKHVMLVDVKEFLVLGDPLGRVRSHSPESVILKSVNQSTQGKHGKKNPDKTQWSHKKWVHSGVLVGGLRGIRRLSNSMLTDIVRSSMQVQHKKKKKNWVDESGIFNKLVGNDHVLKDVNVIVSAESVPELSSLGEWSSKSGSQNFLKNYSLIRRGSSNLDVNSFVMRHLCSFAIDSTVYSDCRYY